MQSILIVGGGIAGLMAAYKLSQHQQQVILLEAKNRLGGRIDTCKPDEFSQSIELGAEFIHGDLPITISLLKEANIYYHKISDKMLHFENGKPVNQSLFSDGWDEIMHKMDALESDMTLIEFLNKFFNDDQYNKLRESIKDFAGGFDLADINTASTKSLYKEWKEEMGDQYRLDGGYKMLINYLEAACKKNGCIIEKNCCVKKINWQQDEVSVTTMCSRLFKASKIILAVPASVLQADKNDNNYIEFNPAIPTYIDAARNIGFGPVIKVLLEFNENFWYAPTKKAGFILTDEAIPTWWTQLPLENNLLTGWVGGAKANSLKLKTDDEILQIALQSLANAFALSFNEIQSKLKAHKIVNWNKEADINGGYSFNILKSVDAKKVLNQPINNTLFFTGEALFDGTPVGTVEAALSSAVFTVEQLLKNKN